MARKKYTESQRQSKLRKYKALRDSGETQVDAAQKVGVGSETLKSWAQRDQKAKVVFHSPAPKRTYKKKQKVDEIEHSKVAVIICEPKDVAGIIGGL